MQPQNESNFNGLVNDWYQATENHEAGTSFKMKLFHQTEVVALILKRLVRQDNTKIAQELADMILHSFVPHGIQESEGLISWIGANTLKWGDDIEGAYKSFHHLFKALQFVDNANAPRPQEGSNLTYKEGVHKTRFRPFESLFGKRRVTENLSDRDYYWSLSAPGYIDSAAMNL